MNGNLLNEFFFLEQIRRIDWVSFDEEKKNLFKRYNWITYPEAKNFSFSIFPKCTLSVFFLQSIWKSIDIIWWKNPKRNDIEFSWVYAFEFIIKLLI